MVNPADLHCGGDHAPSRARGRRALGQALLISAIFMVAEAIGGYWTDSLALMADAGHMLTDVGALALSLFAAWVSSRPSSPRRSFGYHRVEIFAALLNGVGLLLLSGLIVWEALGRLREPRVVAAGPMLVIAILGLAANLLCARILYAVHQHNLNVRGALLHVLGDALGSVAAIAAGCCMLFWNWYLADPLTSLMVAALIVIGAWRLLKDSVDILLEGAPAHIDVEAVERELATVEGIVSIHDLHVWSISSGMLSMSCHAVVRQGRRHKDLLPALTAILRDRFRIEHTTIQLEEAPVDGRQDCQNGGCRFARA